MTPQQMVAEIGSLISFPEVALQVNQLINDEDSSVSDIAKVIEHDPALTARLLKVANSAMLNTGVEITDVDRAITRLGSRQINELLLGIDVAHSFDKMPNSIVSMDNYWRHCLYCAVISREMAKELKLDNANSAFSAGLLHDIGHLIMFSKIPEESTASLHRSLDEYDGLIIYRAELDEIGFDHTDVGLELAKQWNLPKIFQDCIYAHHQPHKLDPEIPKLVWVVHIANILAVLAELGSYDFDDAAPILDEAWQVLNLNQESCFNWIDESQDAVNEILKAFTS
jgi:putative nucleotidyltransferase with HDIG domain